jgi:tRNA isopentenyl-2-thiomethyl-A-37 hydroxylase MiaE
LLKELIKNTSRDHEDYEQLCTAYASIKDIAEFHNENKRKEESVLSLHNFEVKQFSIPVYCDYCSKKFFFRCFIFV